MDPNATTVAVWTWWRAQFASEYVWSVLTTVAIHEVFYFGVSGAFALVDYGFCPPLNKYRLQPAKEDSRKAQVPNALRRLLLLHFFLEAPMIALSHPILQFLGMETSLPLPAWTTIAWKIAVFFVIEDFYFYFIHRLLHVPWFYKNVHKIHHEHAAPFGMVAEYAHPVETMFLGFGTMLGPLLLARHQMTLWVWLIVRVFQTVECHSGYNFPWSLNRWVPLWGGAEFHEHHHRTFLGNYASTFVYMDHLFGTDARYLSSKRRLAATGSEGDALAEAKKRYAFDSNVFAGNEDGTSSSQASSAEVSSSGEDNVVLPVANSGRNTRRRRTVVTE